jgi:saccharopine dehydrogenase (NAD+, L-lysine-forming)
MFFEELRGLPSMFPNLRETGFYISGSNFITDALITPLVLVGLKLFPKRGVRPLGKLLWWGMSSLSRPPFDLVLQVDARGWKDEKRLTARARLGHPDGYEFTAIPVAACVRQMLDGSARKPGLWMMGHLAEPLGLMADMQRMGVQFEWSDLT